MQKRTAVLVLTIATVFAASACGSGTPEPTATPEPTQTPMPTNTPPPTDTPEPTNTPKPTDTPEPTNSARPTETPTPYPEYQSYRGTGDSVIDIDPYTGPAAVHVVGNSSGAHFAVKSYGPGNEEIDLLVNTTEPYDGSCPINLLSGEEVRRLQVTATGDWRIEVNPLTASMYALQYHMEVPGTEEGDGDDVIVLTGQTPDLAEISGNEAANHFAVRAYSIDEGVELLVNTTEPYDGMSLLDPSTVLLVVIASDSWRIEVTAAQ
jgi:hypothetical protein